MPRPPLTHKQQRAAALIGRGRQKKAVASELGVHARTVSKWCGREDFAALVDQARAGVLEERPTAHATLEGALTATKSDGGPDWQVRVSAARALVGVDRPPEPGPPRETTIHVGNLEDAGGDAR